MNFLTVVGKTLDQPLLVSKISRKMPAVLITGAVGYGLYDTYKAPDKKQNKRFIKNFCILGATVASALVATRGIKPLNLFGRQIYKGFGGLTNIQGVNELKITQNKLISDFIKENPLKRNIIGVLNKAKTKILKFSEVKTLYEELGKTESGNKFLKKLIPEPENITSKKIFKEIGRLSLIGLIPVVGGVLGGIAGDKLTEKNWKDKIPDKIKEGSYQYLANIFLCNVGAGAALGLMEKMNIKSKAAKAAGMTTGILTAGVIGGSAIANYIGTKCINPVFERKGRKGKKHCKQNIQNLYSERKPEVLDIGMHSDDMATVAVLSGLRWIEPALPLLYSISGYRAGIGYRNGSCQN